MFFNLAASSSKTKGDKTEDINFKHYEWSTTFAAQNQQQYTCSEINLERIIL